MSRLTPKQEQVLALLAQGSTVTAAAEQTGVHRNTISNWRRTLPEFQDALAAAQFEQGQFWRQRLASFGEPAVETLAAVFADANVPPMRLRAAMLVLDKITRPGLAQPEFAASRRYQRDAETALMRSLEPPLSSEFVIEQIELEQSAIDRAARSQTAPQPTVPHEAAPRESSENCTILHKPEPGRNAPCPCGSGFKYKRCCLFKEHSHTGLLAKAA